MTTNQSSVQGSVQSKPEAHFPALLALLNDTSVYEIMVDGHTRVYVEAHNEQGLRDVPSPYRDQAQLMAEISAFAAYMGQVLDSESPILDGWLPDGSRVNVVLPPVSPSGPVLNIRKYSTFKLTDEELIRFGAWDEDIVTFLTACVRARLNIIVAGGANSGKTTVLNILAAKCDPDERVINVGGEARLTHRRAIVLEPRQSATADGTGEITLSRLIDTATRMRPDRIILTEIRGPEALPFMEALNMGHTGALATLTANSPRDALSRIELLASMGNPALPLLAIRELMASGIHLIVSQQRLRDGGRRIMKVTEVIGMQGDTIQTQDIFTFQPTGTDEGRIVGHFTATGNIPRCLELIRNANVDVPLSLFTPR